MLLRCCVSLTARSTRIVQTTGKGRAGFTLCKARALVNEELASRVLPDGSALVDKRSRHKLQCARTHASSYTDPRPLITVLENSRGACSVYINIWYLDSPRACLGSMFAVSQALTLWLKLIVSEKWREVSSLCYSLLTHCGTGSLWLK